VRGENAERLIEEVRGDDLELASYLRIEERELERGQGTGCTPPRLAELEPNCVA
jgi:hypothetical protein